eukprot:s872_g11.t2
MPRAGRRVLLAGKTAEERRKRSKGYRLRDFTIAPKTRARYEQAVGRIVPFLEAQKDLTFLDDVICEWIEAQWARGESVNFIADTLSGLHFYWPELRGQLRVAWRLFKQWRRIEAPSRAPPITVVLVRAIVCRAVQQGDLAFATLIALGFHALLRTGELLSLRFCDLEFDLRQIARLAKSGYSLLRPQAEIREPQKIQRSRYFRAYCTGRLHEVSVALAEDAAWVPALKGALHRCNLALISENCGSGELVTEIIDLSLKSLEDELQNLQQEVWELDRKKMENLKTLVQSKARRELTDGVVGSVQVDVGYLGRMLNPRDVAGAQASPGKKLLRVEIQSLGGAAFQVTCSLNETLLHLKQYICSSGGPLVRDQKLVWNRADLCWIHETEASVDSFSLFYLGIIDARPLRLCGVSRRWLARRLRQLRQHQEAVPVVSTSVPVPAMPRRLHESTNGALQRLWLYSLATPNGWKVGILLEELDVAYDAHVVNIGAGEQFSSGFVGANPNSKIPALIDHDGPKGKAIAIMERHSGTILMDSKGRCSNALADRDGESGAIMLYLAEKHQRFIPTDARERCECLQWLFWQVAGQGPMTGNFGHFKVYAPDHEVEARDYGVARYGMEVQRLCSVLELHLSGLGDFSGAAAQGSPREFLVGGSYSIADMACFPWVYMLYGKGYNRPGQPDAKDFLGLQRYPQLKAWVDRIAARPAVQRGIRVCARNAQRGVAAPPNEETRPEVGAVNEEEDEDGIDFTALTEAQHAGADAAERRKRRAGTKESAKRRKRQKRENDILCVKQAGIALPSLHDVLKGNKKAIVIPSLKEALQRQNATDQEGGTTASREGRKSIDLVGPSGRHTHESATPATPATPAANPITSPSAGEAGGFHRPGFHRGVCYDDLEDDPPASGAPLEPEATEPAASSDAKAGFRG